MHATLSAPHLKKKKKKKICSTQNQFGLTVETSLYFFYELRLFVYSQWSNLTH